MNILIGESAIKGLLLKLKKLFCILKERKMIWLRSLRFGVAASVEHMAVLHHLNCKTIVDIGANRGQFALVARNYFPEAIIMSFEPLPKPASIMNLVFSDDDNTVLFQAAIGPTNIQCEMHISARDDSSSLLPISSLQEEIFPGTSEVGTVDVHVAPLSTFIGEDDIEGLALLKLDVQGFELDALHGCDSLLPRFEWVYCECSFVELYSGQKLAADVIDWLSRKDFKIQGIYNPSYDNKGLAIQADFLFQRRTMAEITCA